MKKGVICFIVTCFIFICTPVFAHPPTKIVITYDKNTKLVEAVITHPVSNPDKHHIGKVDCAINGKEILEHTIRRQDNNTDQKVVYRIPDAKSGDEISIEAYCNISGKLLQKITVE